jgi:hypothetical protein
MIITKNITINITRRNITFYRKLGYILTINTKLLIPIDHLAHGSKNKILASCDICNNEYDVVYRDYLKSLNIHNFATCNKCKYEKIKLTNNGKYGCDSPLQNNDIMEKFLKTNNERYGGNSSSCDETILNKQRSSRIKNGIETPSGKQVSEFKKYSNRVRNLTKKHKKELFGNWDGHDYYDSEYIFENLTMRPSDRLYPTIEHKISVYHGFMNNIHEDEISKLENLVITKKYINSSKGNMDFNLFKMRFDKFR